MPIKVRKYVYPNLQVYYKDKFIGRIQNDIELIYFRMDVMDSGEHENYIIMDGKTIYRIDKYGGMYNYPYKELDNALTTIVTKQMDLRKKDAEI